MFNAKQAAERRGVVLLVVITMLVLFAVVALSFVYYADGEATSSRYAVQAASPSQADLDSEMLLSYFLGQLISDTDNIYSAMRGHSLGRTMYGYNPDPLKPNIFPFNGTGRLRYPVSAPFSATPQDNYYLVNYQLYNGDNFRRDPEFYGTSPNPLDPNSKGGPYLGGANVPYTYPDLNNMVLAAVDANGKVLIPSFCRSWIPGLTFDPNNPAVSDPWQRYLTLRPHPSYHSQFVCPDSELVGNMIYDVKNLDNSPGTAWGSNNDSIWIDPGFPVMTAPNGKKFKPLFAPLIIDLDGRVNLSIAGNIKNVGAQASNQGWGRWEINPGKCFPNGLPNAAELTSWIQYRYGGNNGPAPVPAVQKLAPYYSRFDFDGICAGGFTLPAAGSVSLFPSYPAGWDSGQAAEMDSTPLGYVHPAGFNYFTRPLVLSNMEGMLRYGGKGSPALTSDSFRKMPTNMANLRARNLGTLLSMDLDRQGVIPYITFDPGTIGKYTYDATKGYPKVDSTVGVPFPKSDGVNNPTLNSEFGSDWRSNLAALQPSFQRLNLNRVLTDYPVDTLDAATGQFTDVAIFNQAQTDRQNFAKDIYNYLLRVTGSKKVVNGDDPATLEYQASRWLAQIAVNIVDYIDNDDIMTPFTWIEGGTEVLFGVEPPRLVINEAYAQYDNDPEDNDIITNNKAGYYRLNVWTELHNPMRANGVGEKYPINLGNAVLKAGTHIPYQVVLCKLDPTLKAVVNLRGDPDPAKLFAGGAGTVDDWGAIAVEQSVSPANDVYSGMATSNQGFYVLGPQAQDPTKALFLAGRDPTLTTTWLSKKMSPRIELVDNRDNPTILLRRLACPYRPFEPDATLIMYNPYITVDYIENLTAHDGRVYDELGLKAVAPLATTTYFSEGRTQPYAACANQQKPQAPQITGANPPTPGLNQPKHTFYRHNAVEDNGPPDAATVNQTLKTPFDWLVQLDRQLINPLELLHISGVRPHELTQRFVDNASGKAFSHYAPWFTQETLLYRFLEMATTPDLMAGMSQGGRSPGKININTIWDADGASFEVFRALCDRQAMNGFTDADVDAIWTKLRQTRTPGSIPDSIAAGIPSKYDRPFLPLGVGFTAPDATPYAQYGSKGLGIEDTILRDDGAGMGNRLFSVPGATHPYKQFEVLSKIYNNITTRSNCFAVWLTVGFFEVDDNFQPPKLGQEIGRAENRHIRHRMFAIIDRTELKLFGDKFVGTIVPGPAVVIPMTSLTGTADNGRTWSIQPGCMISVRSTGPLNEKVEEDVMVTGVDTAATPPTFTATFTKNHDGINGIIRLIVRGNPGPWPTYSVRQDPNVVPHFSIID